MNLRTQVARAHRRGGSGPELLYVPGIDGCGELLLGTARGLEGHFDLLRLRYEVTGPRPPQGDSYADLAASIVDVLDQERLQRPLVLAESFGVALALRLALDAPERVAGLALVNGFARYERRIKVALSQLLLPLVPAKAFRSARHIFSPRALLGPRHSPSVAAAFRAADLSDPGPGYRRRLAMIRSVDLLDELALVRVPTEVYAADRDRVVDSVAAGQAIVDRIPNSRLTVLERAGHLVLPLQEEPWVERMRVLQARAEE